MRNNVIFILSLLLLLSSACKKEIIQEEIIFPIFNPGLKTYGSLTALKNGIKWEASGHTGNYAGSIKKGITGIIGQTFFDDKIPYIMENMGFSLIPLAVGTYKLNQFNPSSYFFKEGEAIFNYGYMEDDVEVNPFELVPEANNYVEVTKIDSLHMEGRFDVTCKGKYKIKGVTHIYRFSEGKFNVLFKK